MRRSCEAGREEAVVIAVGVVVFGIVVRMLDRWIERKSLQRRSRSLGFAKAGEERKEVLPSLTLS